MSVVEMVINVLAPHKCVLCSTGVKPLCEDCKFTLQARPISRCTGCNRLTANNRQCPMCRKKDGLRTVWSATVYDETAKQIVMAYKYKQVRALARPIAQVMRQSIDFADFDIVCPVPTAPQRIRARGYDHAELMAKHIGRMNSITHTRLLVRFGNKQQVGSNKQTRHEWAQKSYGCFLGSEIKNKRILLVDDIVSTGATVSACSRLLKSKGAKSVDALVFARN